MRIFKSESSPCEEPQITAFVFSERINANRQNLKRSLQHRIGGKIGMKIHTHDSQDL